MKWKNRAAAVAAKTQKLTEARDLAAQAETAGRNLTATERTTIKARMDEARAIHSEVLAIDGDKAVLDELNALGTPAGSPLFGGGKDYRGSGLAVAGHLSTKMLGESVGRKAVLESGSTLVPTPVVGELHRDGERPQMLSELLPVAPVTGDRFRYLRQTVRTNLAAAVARGTQKPESVFTVESVDERTRTVAHVSEPIPRQDLDDSLALQSFIAAELRYGTLETLDDLIVTGDGEGENFEGLLEVSGTGVTTFETDAITTARKAKTNLQVLHVNPSHWLISPGDWEALELTRSDEAFVLGDPGTAGSSLPVDRARQRLWGTDVIVSTAVPEGTGILLDAADTVLVMRETVRVDMSENVADDYTKNLVRLRSELRAALAVLRPAGVMAVELVAGS